MDENKVYFVFLTPFFFMKFRTFENLGPPPFGQQCSEFVIWTFLIFPLTPPLSVKNLNLPDFSFGWLPSAKAVLECVRMIWSQKQKLNKLHSVLRRVSQNIFDGQPRFRAKLQNVHTVLEYVRLIWSPKQKQQKLHPTPFEKGIPIFFWWSVQVQIKSYKNYRKFQNALF